MCTSCYSMHSQWPYNWANGTEWTSASIFMASWRRRQGNSIVRAQGLSRPSCDSWGGWVVAMVPTYPRCVVRSTTDQSDRSTTVVESNFYPIRQ